MLNVVILQGRWATDGELKDLGNDRVVFNGRIAVEENYRPENGEPETEFFAVEAWGGRAEALAQFARKGAMVLIKGRLTINRWRPDDSKFDVERPVIRVDEFQLIGFTSKDPITRDEAPQYEPEPAAEEPAPSRATRAASRNSGYSSRATSSRTASRGEPVAAGAGASRGRGGRRPF